MQAKWTAFLLRIILLNLLNIKQTIYKVTCTQAPSCFPRNELFLLHYSRSLLLSTGHSPNLKHHSAPIALWCRVVSFLVSNHIARNTTWLWYIFKYLSYIIILRERFFRLVTSVGQRKNSEYLRGIEPQTFRFRAPMLYQLATETLRWARSITKFVWHASCILQGSPMSIASCLYIE